MSDDEVLVRTINPNHVEPVWADWFISAGVSEGIVNIIMGSFDPLPGDDAEGSQSVIVTSNLKMSMSFAERLRDLLQSITANAAESDSSINQPSADDQK